MKVLSIVNPSNIDKLARIVQEKDVIWLSPDTSPFPQHIKTENKYSFKEATLSVGGQAITFTEKANVIFSSLYLSFVSKANGDSVLRAEIYADKNKINDFQVKIGKDWKNNLIPTKLNKLNKTENLSVKLSNLGKTFVTLKNIEILTRLENDFIKELFPIFSIQEIVTDNDDLAKKLSKICRTINLNKIESQIPRPTISILTPTYNGLQHIKKCADHLFSNAPILPFEWLVLDDGSTDGTEDFFKSLNKQNIVYIKPQHPIKNFSKANNILAQKARGKYLLLLNNDCYVQRNAIDIALRHLEENPFIGAVGGLLLFPDTRKIQHCGVVFVPYEGGPLPGHLFHNETTEKRSKFLEKPRLYQAVTAAFSLIRKDIFENVNGFNEEYEFGYEDIDLCLKIRESGYQILFDPKSIALHEQGGTLDAPHKKAEKQRMFHKNKKIFQTIWGDKPSIDAAHYNNDYMIYKPRVSNPKIVYFPAARGHGHDIYRTDHAVDGLRRSGCDVTIGNSKNRYDASIYMMQRLSDLEAIRSDAIMGYDIDDYIFDKTIAIESGLPDHIVNEADKYKNFMARCDFFTTTTKYLASEIQKKFHKPTFVVPNAVDYDFMNQEQISDSNNIIIGYASGTSTHDADFKTIIKPLSVILEKYPNAILRVIGYLDKNLLAFENRIEHYPFVNFDLFPKYLQKFDINLAPLTVTPFNHAKSPLKYIEAGALCIPTVATATKGYEEAIVHGRNGFLCTSDEDWIRWLSFLIEKKDLRFRIGTEAKADVMSRFTTEHMGTYLNRILGNFSK